MPELPPDKIRPLLPALRSSGDSPKKESSNPPYAELQVTSNFSFLRGGSHPEELVTTAHLLGYRGIAITDRNSLAGIVRAHTAATELRLPFAVGSHVLLRNSADDSETTLSLLLYPTDRASYGRLCRFLTIGKRRASRGVTILALDDLDVLGAGFIAIAVPPLYDPHRALTDRKVFETALEVYRKRFSHLSIALTSLYHPRNRDAIECVLDIARRHGVRPVVTNDVHYHVPERRALQDIVTCIRERCTVEEAGFRLFAHRERYLKSPREMHRIFAEHRAACLRTVEILESASGFSLSSLKYEYPEEIVPDGYTSREYLEELVREGAAERFPDGIPEKVRKLIADELELIGELCYEKYFLTCYDIVRRARELGILCQGRGAAANSAVCYCLGITAVNPDKIELLFARFISKERNEPPDIDIDFEHERREEVIQYIYERFGRHRAGLTCEVVSYRQRSAVRDVGKALGLSLEDVDRLAKSIHRWTGGFLTDEDLRELGFDPSNERIRNTLRYSAELMGFPRHLSQHVGGFIISERALSETVPILNASMEDRTIIEWDKDDIDALGMLKIDVLGLGMLSCVRKALGYINEHRTPEQPLTMATIPSEDPAVYDMACAADTVGVFQIESRAQMSMLPRLKPRCFYDLVIEVAIVRPGPIQGNMVHPFLKRRSGLEKAYYPDDRVRDILGKTMGVPIFQEQAMRLAIVLARFPPGEAERLRRAMAAWKRNPHVIATFKERIVAGMLENGYTREFAESCMNQIRGFSEYGFPESHAASFALIVYASLWIKCHHPAEFAAALINSQPMGFYAPAQIVQDAMRHGVKTLPVDISKSRWDCTFEHRDDERYPLIRLGMRLIKGLREEEAETLAEIMREPDAPRSIHHLWITGKSRFPLLRRRTLKLLAQADALTALVPNRRDALWEVQALPVEPVPLDHLYEPVGSDQIRLPLMTPAEHLFRDYELLGLSLKGHPIGLIRSHLDERGVSTAAQLKTGRKSTGRVGVAGISIIKQRPGTAKGMVFITLEDETGMANLVITPQRFEEYQRIILASSCLLAHGVLERTEEVVYITVNRLENLDSVVLSYASRPLPTRSYSY